MPKPSRITDERFANFETDPRFRLPSKRKTKTTIDKRFSRLLKDEEFTATTKVDRYGRKIKSDAKKKALQRLYQPEDEEEDENEGEEVGKGVKGEENGIEVDDDEVVQRELDAVNAKYDPARGGGFSSSESESESDSGSESDSDLEDDEEGGAEIDNNASMQRMRDEQAAVETGEVTTRIAAVNLDWDHIKSQDLMAVFSSFLPATGGRIEKISILPSQFGKERMQREELEGPPREIFKAAKSKRGSGDDGDDAGEGSDSESDAESDGSSDPEEDEQIKNDLIQEGDDQDFDSTALRSYQLDRLRYYFAVMTFSDKATAQKVYEATDGTEYQSSSNFIDLRFIPDDVTFDEEPRDECTKIPEGYKPIDFITDALQHSKVKLTWDLHPEEAARKDSINRAFTGSKDDLEENDLLAYLASDSEEDEPAGLEADSAAVPTTTGIEDESQETNLSKKELARRKMRAALGLSEEMKKDKPKSRKDAAPVGDMQITFAPALSSKSTTQKSKKSGGEKEEEETTIEKYKRKERERKEKKRDAAKARREGRIPTSAGGTEFDDEGDNRGEVEEDEDEEEEEEQEGQEEEDLGFDDPFFTSEATASKKSKTSIRKEERLKKRAAREAKEAESAKDRAQLELLMDSEDEGLDAATGGGRLSHFDMGAITKAEKEKKKKSKYQKKGKKNNEKQPELQQGFKMDVNDDRFKAVFENHEFAIDPSNPRYQNTEAMRELVEEGRKKRKVDDDDVGEEEDVKAKKKARKGGEANEGLGKLIESVKRKSGSKSKTKKHRS